MSKPHQSVVRNQGYTRAAVSHIERHNERKNENYSNIDVDLTQTCNNVYFKNSDSTYLGAFDKMVQDDEISTRGLKLNNEGTKPESNIVAEMIFDVNTEYFEMHHEQHGYASAHEFANAFYYDAYQMAVKEVGDEKYILSAVMHADERNKGLSEELGRDVFHYHLHVTYIPVVQKEIFWTKRCKDLALVGTVKEVINQVNHSKKWESEKEVGEDGKERLVYSYSKLQDRYHDHMKAAGYSGFERGKEKSTAKHLSVLEYKAKMRQAELDDKISKLELADMEKDEVQTEIGNLRDERNSLRAETDLLQFEKEQLETEVAPLRELQKLKIETEKIKTPPKPSFGTNVKIPYEDLLKLKKMANTYIANRDEIKNLRTRTADVEKRETAATDKEKKLNAREKNLVGKETALAEAADIKADRDRLQSHSQWQSGAMAERDVKISVQSEKLTEAYDAIAHIVKAARLLKYAGNNLAEYKNENLTEKQYAMLDALANYGVRLATKNNFQSQAEEMRKFVSLASNIEDEMKILVPHLYPKQLTSYEKLLQKREQQNSKNENQPPTKPLQKSRSYSRDDR